MLKVDGLSGGYSEVDVLHDVSFETDGEIFAVLGANGAGKTTLLKTLANLLPASRGTITWQDQVTNSFPAHELPSLGIAYVPQESNVFPDLTVAENLSIGALTGERDRDLRFSEVYELFPRLAERKSQMAGSLSGGEGQMLAVGRALMQDPSVLLLDEPSTGLSPLFVDILFEKISEIRKTKGVSIVLAEQNATKALEMADRVLVLSLGQVHLLRKAKGLAMKKLMEAYHI